jgi:hypothetical protein
LMRVAGKEEGKGSKAMAMATQAACERTARLTKRAMAMKTREAGKEEGNGKKGSKRDGNGKEDGDGEQQG